MGVHQLPRVVSVVACILEPHWKPVVIETLGDELRVSTCSS
jgi:hypothetical protein